MTPIIKLMLTSLLVATPATATHMDKEYGQAKAVAAVSGDSKTVRWKDQARLYEGEPGQRNSRLAYVGVSEPAPMAPRRVAQNFVPPLIGMAGPFGSPPPLPPFSAMSMPPQRFMATRTLLPPPTRAMCEARLSSEAALAASLTTRLRLNSDQIRAWRKVEDAAQPALQKLHSVCDRLPVEATTTATMPEALDMLESEMAARLELVRAAREPLRELYEMLTAEQRAQLRPPSAPM